MLAAGFAYAILPTAPRPALRSIFPRFQSARRRCLEDAGLYLSGGSAATSLARRRASPEPALASLAHAREQQRSCRSTCLFETHACPSAAHTARSQTPRCRSACRPLYPSPARGSCSPAFLIFVLLRSPPRAPSAIPKDRVPSAPTP